VSASEWAWETSPSRPGFVRFGARIQISPIPALTKRDDPAEGTIIVVETL
jgi:hypothetical protein